MLFSTLTNPYPSHKITRSILLFATILVNRARARSTVGQLTVELSRHEDFRNICRQEVAKVDESTGCSAVVEFDDLDPNAVWYHRTYLHNPREGFDDPSATFSAKGTTAVQQ